jgi:hypothetical protein
MQKDILEEQQITEKSSTPPLSTNWADEVDATIFTQQLSQYACDFSSLHSSSINPWVSL